GRDEGAVPARRERARLLGEACQLLAREAHLVPEGRAVPCTARVPRLHRLVARVVEAPAEVEVLHRVPVARAQRVGEAAVDRAARVEADEIEALARGDHL